MSLKHLRPFPIDDVRQHMNEALEGTRILAHTNASLEEIVFTWVRQHAHPHKAAYWLLTQPFELLDGTLLPDTLLQQIDLEFLPQPQKETPLPRMRK